MRLQHVLRMGRYRTGLSAQDGGRTFYSSYLYSQSQIHSNPVLPFPLLPLRPLLPVSPLFQFPSATLATNLRNGLAPAAGNDILQNFSPPSANSNDACTCSSRVLRTATIFPFAFFPLYSFTT